MKKTFAPALAVVLSLFSTNIVFAQALEPAIPPNIVTTTARPMIMLNMSRDHQLFYRAYDEFSDLTGPEGKPDSIPETTYAHSFTYYGYFDSFKCYSYSGTSNRFEPTATNTDKYCTGNWSGNFLNWATMTRMDVVRKVLYGGHRSTDTATSTVLERANLPTDAHSFAKYYKGSDLPKLTPFDDELAPSKLISNNNNDNARRVNQFLLASNELYKDGPGTSPAGSTTGTCKSKVDALYPDVVIDPVNGTLGPDPSKPTRYHCVNHAIALGGSFTIQKGDQIRATNVDDATQFMQGLALDVDAGNTWVTILVPEVGFVNPNASNVKKWQIYNLTQTSTTICNTTMGGGVAMQASLGVTGSTDAVNGLSHTNTNPPIMRVAKGDYQLWNANERWQCYWSGEKGASNGNNIAITGLGAGASNPSATSQGVVIDGTGPDFIVRVSACNSSLIGKESCKQYPSGNYKPTGLLHDYGEGNQAEFGLFTGSYAKNISGGVLRSNVGSFKDEIEELTDGSFTSSVKGIVYTMNKIKVYGYRYSDGTYQTSADGNCTYQLSGLSDNRCSSWGNPMGTMFVESLRYLGGLTASSTYDYTESGSKDEVMGLPHPAWVDPFTRGSAVEATFGKGQCRAINAINFNASVTSYDNNERSQWAPFATLPGSPNLVNLINLVGGGENIHGNYWFIGNTPTTANRTCTAKSIGTLATVDGLCPDAPGYKGSYALAGAAYWARNNAVRATTPAILTANPDAYKVKTFSVALAPGKPKIEIPHPTVAGQKIVLQPSYQLTNGSGTVIGTGTLVDFRVVGTPTATSGKFLIVWEDSEQGGDYDSDVSGILRYEVVGTTVYIYTQVFYAATANPQGFGYTISGSNKDGAHFHSGILNYNFTDPTNLTVTQSDGTAHANINTSGGCTACQSAQPESRATYAFSGTAAGQLADPLWYAAKWGGFAKVEVSPATDPKTYRTEPAADKSNWDVKQLDGSPGADGVPDNYFLAIRPDELVKALRSAFEAIINDSNTAPAVAAAQIQVGSLKYLASFDGEDGHGELKTYAVKADGNFDTAVNWEAHTKLTAVSADSRNIITNVGNSTGLPFTWSALSDAVKTVAFGGTNATAQARLNWLRGDRSNEAPSGLNFKKRNIYSVMGGVVNSNPVVSTRPDGDYFGAAFPGYGAFVTANKARKDVVWFGTSDGMLHGFDASTLPSDGGVPMISYVPQVIHNRLTDLTDSTKPKIQSFVDGSPFVGDVQITSGTPAVWKTYLFGALGRGGKGMFALDVTDPTALTQANASSIFKWQFSTADDSSGDLGYNLSQFGTVHRSSQQASAIARMNNGKFAVIQPNGISSDNGSAALYILFVNGPTSGAWATPANYVKLVADVGPNNGLAQPTWVDVDNDGIADYVYAGDLKGNVWKFDVKNADPANWKVAYANADGTNKRPLFVAKDSAGNRLPITSSVEYRFHPLGGIVIVVGTGKSVKQTDFPDNTNAHAIFGIWDAPLYTTAPYVTDPTKLSDTTQPNVATQSPGLPRNLSELQVRTMTRVTLDDADPTNGVVGQGYVSGNAIDWGLKKGWYLDFPDTSEMMVSNPNLIQGLIAAVSIAPSTADPDSCFKGPLSYITFIDPISGLLTKDILGQTTLGLIASKRIEDQRVTIATDSTRGECAAGEISCVRIIGQKTDEGGQVRNTQSRLYWREIPGFKTR